MASSRHAAAQTSKPFSDLIVISTFLVTRTFCLEIEEFAGHPASSAYRSRALGRNEKREKENHKMANSCSKKHFKIVVKMSQNKKQGVNLKKNSSEGSGLERKPRLIRGT